MMNSLLGELDTQKSGAGRSVPTPAGIPLLLRLFATPLVMSSLSTTPLLAEEPPLQGRFYILAIEEDKVFIDMGRKDGVETNMTLQVFKTGVSFDHPVTGEKVVGTTYLADIQIVEVSDVFSIARPSAAIIAQLKPGYEIRFRPQDLEQVRSSRARLADLEAELKIDKETWQERATREMVRYNNNNNEISTSMEMVYFSADDNYTHTQMDFTYRLFRDLYGIRFGIGTMTGRGRVYTISEDYDYVESVGDVGFYYGYSTLEYRPMNYLSFIPRFQLGLNNDGVGVGGGLDLRIGPELGTNMVLSAGGARLVGSHAGISFNHYVTERLYVSGRAAIENYVTGEDSSPAVRVLLGTHYDITKKVQLDLGAGIGGRDINHMGPSVSAGLSFNFPTGLWWMQELE